MRRADDSNAAPDRPVHLPDARRPALLRLSTESREADAPVPAPRYLVLAMLSAHPGIGQHRQLLAAFTDEAEARSAFESLRLRSEPRAAWAQMVELDGRGRLHPLRWFGPAPLLDDGSDAPWGARRKDSEVKPAVRRRWTWPRNHSEAG